MKSQNILVAILVASLALSSLLFNEDKPIWEKLYPKSTSEDQQGSESPEYEVSGFESKKFNAQGKLNSNLKAKSLSFYANDKLSVLDDIFIQIFGDDIESDKESRWELKAKHAKSTSPNTHVFLKDSIEMTQSVQNSASDSVQIFSNEMELHLDKKTAHSNAKVRIKSGENIIQGKGFESDFNKNEIKLKSQVSSQYFPQTSSGNLKASSKDDTLTITANSFSLEGESKAKYSGNVILKQANIIIKADTIRIIRKNEEQQMAFAYGNPATFEQLPTLSDKQPIFAQAKRFEFNSQDQKLKMYEEAKLQQGDATVEGGYLFYDTKTENIGAESRSDKRVKMTLPSKASSK